MMGQPGTGKTIFAQQLAFHNADDNRHVLYLTTLSEPVAKIIKHVQRFQFFDEDKIGSSIKYEDVGHDLAKAASAVSYLDHGGHQNKFSKNHNHRFFQSAPRPSGVGGGNAPNAFRTYRTANCL